MLKKQLKFFIVIGAISGLFLVLSYFLNVPSVKADDSMLIRELLFTVEDSQGDAIGVKIMENPQRLPPLLWYNQNVSNPASPSYFAVDNYYALRDGRTVYVGAPNLDNTSGYEISSYIYIFSYNEGASSETINIFNQLLENLRFNHNINNLTEKRELQRDLLRIYDFSEIENSLNNYYNSSRRYPALSSGTYVLGKTYTTWPSWQYTLSSELGQSLPVDPINRFNGSCSACPDNTSQPDYQCSGTCYNPMTGDFIHPNGSHVYEYYAPQDISCDGQGYSLYANLEYKPDTSDVVWLGALPTENIIIDQDDSLGTYNYSISQGIGECGNGILNMCEECECNSGGLVCTEGNFMPEKTCLDLGLGAGIYASGLQCVNCHWRREVCDKMDLGANCTADAQCLSGYCSDGVCCDTSCQGLCQSCNNNGICQLVGYGDDPRNVCAEGDCSLGFCDGFGSCELGSAGNPICKYCSVDGQYLNTPSGEDYNNACGDNDIANCETGYCDGFGSCSYYPEGFICADCKKCGVYGIDDPLCDFVPEDTDWGFNFVCDADGNFVCYNDWANCDNDWSNGCETYLLTDNEHCGGCNQPCNSEEFCVLGNCLVYQSGGTVNYAGKDYHIVLIGGQEWFLENLDVGSRIDGADDQGIDCSSLAAIEKYCYANNEANCTISGALYQWDQAMCGSTIDGAQGICPDGWHIPTDEDYKTLEMYLGMTEAEADNENWRGTTEGDELKADGLCFDRIPCGTSGFNALTTSIRNINGTFSPIITNGSAYFWSSSLVNDSRAWSRATGFGTIKNVLRAKSFKIVGYSIRCLKD